MGLNSTKFGLSIGIVWCLGLLLVSILHSFFGMGESFIALFGELYRGYDATISGTIIGMIWGLLDGFIGGFLVAWVYNKL